MRFDGERLQVQDEAGVARDTAVCAWLRCWKHWSFKGALFLRLTDPTAAMPFVRCSKKRRHAKRLAVNIGDFGDSDAVLPASLSVFFFFYPYDRLWYIDRMELW